MFFFVCKCVCVCVCVGCLAALLFSNTTYNTIVLFTRIIVLARRGSPRRENVKEG